MKKILVLALLALGATANAENSIQKFPILAETDATQKFPILSETDANQKFPILSETEAAQKFPILSETDAAQQFPILTETSADQKFPILTETDAEQKFPILTETDAAQKFPILSETDAEQKFPILAETKSSADTTPVGTATCSRQNACSPAGSLIEQTTQYRVGPNCANPEQPELCELTLIENGVETTHKVNRFCVTMSCAHNLTPWIQLLLEHGAAIKVENGVATVQNEVQVHTQEGKVEKQKIVGWKLPNGDTTCNSVCDYLLEHGAAVSFENGIAVVHDIKNMSRDRLANKQRSLAA